MSTLVGDRLPARVMETFDGKGLAGKIGLGYLLVTSDPDGQPRPCMLSCGEILAVDGRRLRLALWQGTGTSGNLSRGSSCLFCYVAEGTVLYVRGLPASLGSLEAHHLDCFDVHVSSVESDDHPGMPATDTFRFSLTSQSVDSVVGEWEERLAALGSL